MIKVNKSPKIPSHLLSEGQKQTQTDIAEFLIDSTPFYLQNKTSKKEFNKSIYGHPSVKEQLKKDQHYKCCYCETNFIVSSPGDVEHFRPKTAYKELGIKKKNKPSYYWLAYDWNNLFFSCEVCNREYKKEYFPLEEKTLRSIPHNSRSSIEDEKPLLISPLENTEEHIEFNKDTILAKTRRGEVSITLYGLRRKGLLDSRYSKFLELDRIKGMKGDEKRVTQEMVNSLNEISGESYTIYSLRQLIEENNKFIAYSISDKGEYSLMTRSNFSL